MRILPVTQIYKPYPQWSNVKNSPSFKAFSNLDEEDFARVGDGDLYKPTKIKNYTSLLRNALFWGSLPYLLQDKFPNGAKIYEYACSTGHESASIVISLKDKLPSELFEKFMPVYAFDNNKEAVHKAKSRKIVINGTERNLFDTLEKSKPEYYFYKANSSNLSDDTFYKRSLLTTNIVTDSGDLLKDMNKLRAENKPVILFFRNASQFMTPKGRSLTAQSLFQVLPPKSIIITGDMDTNRWYYGDSEKNFGDYLISAGFKKVDNSYPKRIIKENERCKNGLPLKFVCKASTCAEQDGIEHFCFEKP